MKLTPYDVEVVLADLHIESAGPPENSKCYKRHELARELFQRLDLGRWDGKVEPSNTDDVIIGNG